MLQSVLYLHVNHQIFHIAGSMIFRRTEKWASVFVLMFFICMLQIRDSEKRNPLFESQTLYTVKKKEKRKTFPIPKCFERMEYLCCIALVFLFTILPSSLQCITFPVTVVLHFYPFFVPLLNTIHHLFHTFTAGWRPESNRASFLMMLPTPGMTAWSRRTSQSILLLWLFTASSQWEKLNLGEHTSRLSIALTLCSQSSVNLQVHSFILLEELQKYLATVTATVPQGHQCTCEVIHFKTVYFIIYLYSVSDYLFVVG